MAQVEEVSPFEGTLSWGQMTLAADSRACSELTTSILPASEAVSASSNTPGWYYRSNFKGNTCDAVNDVAYEISAEITNTCLVTPLGAIYNHCDSNYVYTYYYNTSSCSSNKSLYKTTKVPLTCTATANNNDDVNGGYSALLTQCTNSTAVYPFTNGYTYAAKRAYPNNRCTNIIGFNANVNDVCVASSDNSSYIYQYPTETKYSKTSNCTGLSSTSKVYNPLCSIVEVGDDFFTSTVLSYTNSGLMYTTPTQQPTASPFFPSGTNSNNDDVSLTDGAIAGIAIGGFVFFAAIITVIYCFACKKATLGEKKEEKDFLSSVF